MEADLRDVERRRWLIDHMLLMPRHEAWLRREVREIRVRRASGTTQIEGAKLGEAAVGRLMAQGAGAKPTEDEQANLNALRAYEFIDYLSDQRDIPIDELVIREMNRQFILGAPELHTPGVYRKGQNTVGRFIPPDQGDVPALMRSFALWLREEDEVHPVVKAGLAHIHLVAIHPFWDGNGRTARGLATLLLQRSQFGFRKLLSLESHLFSNRDSYFTALERTLGTRFSLDYEATPWLDKFTLALAAEVQRLEDNLTDWHRRMQENYDVVDKMGLAHRQVDGLVSAERTGQMTRADYMEITGVSPITASRDLAALVRAGLLIPEGKTRSRIYRPAPKAAQSKIGEPAEQLTLLPET
jgi:Fic family protein